MNSFNQHAIDEIKQVEEFSQISMTMRWGRLSHPRKRKNDLQRLQARYWDQPAEMARLRSKEHTIYWIHPAGQPKKTIIRHVRRKLGITGRVTYLGKLRQP
jgi:hypothetical protein